MDNLGKIGRSLMDNFGGWGGGELGSSLIFYFVAINDDRKSDIGNLTSTKNACRNLYSPGHRCQTFS
jgi:hypothetical protein